MPDLSKLIEHTLLKPDCAATDAKRMVEEAQKHKFAAVCIPPLFCRDARRILGENSQTRLVTVAGFPMGYSSIAAKSEEIKRAVDEGADDIDAVANLAAVKSGNWSHVSNDIESMVRATHLRGRQFKLILECGLLTHDEIRQLCQLAKEFGANYVKTGTGFHGHPATPEMVQTLRKLAPQGLKIKAAGGIRTRIQAEALIQAGADRIGTSASLDIIK